MNSNTTQAVAINEGIVDVVESDTRNEDTIAPVIGDHDTVRIESTVTINIFTGIEEAVVVKVFCEVRADLQRSNGSIQVSEDTREVNTVTGIIVDLQAELIDIGALSVLAEGGVDEWRQD